MGVRNRAYSETFRSHVIGIVRERYADFGPTLDAEKLEKDHGIKIGTETLRGWMKDEGICVDRRGRKPRVFSPRKPREQRGELIKVDGSYHRWFEKRGDEACLIVFIDDATSEIQLLRLVDHESSYNYMACLRTYINKLAVPSPYIPIVTAFSGLIEKTKTAKRQPRNLLVPAEVSTSR